ncbi:MAG: hypothetical protein HY261_05265 [Chloroflexi bacterium]|nr:hypothetical protein [Chloroflexota bacterium]
MIYVREMHSVIGGKLEEFLETCRKDWMLLVEKDGLARVMWFWEWAHGTGPGYRCVSLIQCPDFKSWGELVDRYQRKGHPLHEWYEHAWQYRRAVDGRVMTPTSWSPMPKLPPQGKPVDHPHSLYMHDVAYPFPGHVEKYMETLGKHYFPFLGRERMLSMELCLRVAPGGSDVHEVSLIQRVNKPEEFLRLVKGDAPAHAPARQENASSWMTVSLTVRDNWHSQMLRTTTWSPLD